MQLWERNADWAAVAGRGADAVVVAGRLLAKGYQVLDPTTGAVRRRDNDAIAVWTYRDRLLDLRCAKASDCDADAPGTRAAPGPSGRSCTGGIGFVLDAANPDLPDTRRLTAAAASTTTWPGRQPLPGCSASRSTARSAWSTRPPAGCVQNVEPGRDQRVAVVGGRVLTVTGTAADGTCYYAVVATDPASGRTVWQRDGLNLRTADNAGCEQDRDPAGGEDVVLGVDPDGREALIAAHDGRLLWHGAKGEKRARGRTTATR